MSFLVHICFSVDPLWMSFAAAVAAAASLHVT